MRRRTANAEFAEYAKFAQSLLCINLASFANFAFAVQDDGKARTYSTGSFARYPSRAMIEYFNGLPFSSCIFSGLPSLSTR